MSVDNPEISIIVPVYNVESYLRECLDSVKEQTFTDWECILVDDGSPDNCGRICDEYAKADSRFRVVHQENGGVSVARNKALSLARGRYIGFVDPDDIAHPELFSRLHELITEYDADVAQVSFESLFTTFKRDKHLVGEITELNHEDVVLRLLKGKSLPNYLWVKLFKRELIDTPFPENMVFEDIYVMAHWVKNVRKMVLSPEILYTYRRCGRSIVNSHYAENRLDYLKVIFDVMEILRTTDPEVISSAVREKFLWKGVIKAGKNIARFEEDPFARKKAMDEVAEMGKRVGVPKLRILGLKRYLRARLLLRSPGAFIRLMRFMNGIDIHKRRYKNKQFS